MVAATAGGLREWSHVSHAVLVELPSARAKVRPRASFCEWLDAARDRWVWLCIVRDVPCAGWFGRCMRHSYRHENCIPHASYAVRCTICCSVCIVVCTDPSENDADGGQREAAHGLSSQYAKLLEVIMLHLAPDCAFHVLDAEIDVSAEA